MFFCQTVETILECGYLGRELPNDHYIMDEARWYVEEGFMNVEDGHYVLTEFGKESLLDWFELEYDG